MAEIGKGVNAGKLASNVQKRITRAQEKVLQKLGKADETKDTAFEEEVVKFNKQLADGTKLQKDLKAYMAAVKTMHECSKHLQDCLAEMYDPEWFGKEEVDSITEEMIEKEMDNNLEDTDLLWQDFHQKLVDDALISMDTYLAQFPDIKTRIAKRERKLVDFDSARHHFASIQKSKKKDEAKIAKPLALVEKAAPGWAQGIITAHQIAQTNLSRSQAEEELGRAQKVFEEINYDLQEELPTLWDSRVGLYVNTFQSVAGLEEKFHRDMGKLNQNLSDIMTKLDEQRLTKKSLTTASTGKSEEAANHNLSESGSDAPKSPAKSREGPPVSRPPRPASSQEVKQDIIINLLEDAVVPDINNSTQPQEASLEPDQTPAADPSQQWDSDEEAAAQTYGQQPYEAPQWEDEVAPAVQPYEAPCWDEQDSVSAQSGWSSETAAPAQPDWDDDGAVRWGEEGSQVGQMQDADTNWGSGAAQAWEAESEPPQWEELQSNEAPTVTNGSSDAELPPSVLYKVKVMHDYGATDSDELDLKAGDIVLVLPFANPDEEDDGWLMGVKESHWLQNKNLLAKGVFPENFTQKL
ncbi:myc box-dependent-interacting protein 1-like isoform X1 [Sinocyclocheilus rhinocerous]|uniref:myc box-dependent-interacting protein 1-like isoform X1 n=2 Tax=Sinocyclocheilus rhinocerous TaxID=307959 RepID=UPI0007B9457D|nr:PREDICTED: myc box-dependent-interacting protein 1-like isoform X1 [Sinocyclocheilus rhinocerous]